MAGAGRLPGGQCGHARPGPGRRGARRRRAGVGPFRRRAAVRGARGGGAAGGAEGARHHRAADGRRARPGIRPGRDRAPTRGGLDRDPRVHRAAAPGLRERRRARGAGSAGVGRRDESADRASGRGLSRRPQPGRNPARDPDRRRRDAGLCRRPRGPRSPVARHLAADRAPPGAPHRRLGRPRAERGAAALSLADGLARIAPGLRDPRADRALCLSRRGAAGAALDARRRARGADRGDGAAPRARDRHPARGPQPDRAGADRRGDGGHFRHGRPLLRAGRRRQHPADGLRAGMGAAHPAPGPGRDRSPRGDDGLSLHPRLVLGGVQGDLDLRRNHVLARVELGDRQPDRRLLDDLPPRLPGGGPGGDRRRHRRRGGAAPAGHLDPHGARTSG